MSSCVFVVTGVIQSVSVKEGESTTLNTDVTELLKYDGVLWMFGDSVIDGIQNKQQMLNLDERFTDRLELNMKTGSLTITNTRTTDSGVYDVKVSSKKQIIHKTFNVTVTGEYIKSLNIIMLLSNILNTQSYLLHLILIF